MAFVNSLISDGVICGNLMSRLNISWIYILHVHAVPDYFQWFTYMSHFEQYFYS